jgi:hypothetical protein
MFRRHVAILIAATLAVAGCGEKKEPSGAPVSGTENDRTFTYADNNEIMVGWDPATSYSNENIAMSNMYEQLVRYDSASKKVVPLLAESWRSDRDGRRWTFKLREGVKFHTGRPMDAAAAKAAIKRTKELGEGAGYIWSAVKKISSRRPATRGTYTTPRRRPRPSSRTGSPRDTTPGPAHTRSPNGTRAATSNCGSRRSTITGEAGKARTTGASCSATSRVTPPPRSSSRPAT